MITRALVVTCCGVLVLGIGLSLGLAPRAAAPADRSSLEARVASFRRPAGAPSPADNPTTPAKAELGKALFFDPRLSGSGKISCASCHNPSLGWQDGLALGVGDHGVRLGRRTPTIIDVAWVEPLFWDGRSASLEDQAKQPLAAKTEMNMPHADAARVVASIPGYAQAFRAVFPGEPVSIDTIAKAIAAYERTVVSDPAPFDRWVDGDDTAVGAPAKRGFEIFNGKAKCASCHSGWRFTDDGFRDIGLASHDIGRGRIVPGVQILEHAFKTPTLRNVAVRAPYMHDGSLPTLEAVVDHYDHRFVARSSLAEQITPLHLTQSERADLVAFLRTLTSDDAQATARPTLPIDGKPPA